jgi:hypothetical protein
MSDQITCITKPDAHNTHEAITHVGGTRQGGTRFYITRQECANDIRGGTKSYFVHVKPDTIPVTAYQREGQWFIRTKPDRTQKDNLLNLPQC